MATTSITPDMEANVTGVERADEQRFQHARDCEGNHDCENHTKQRHASALHHDHPPPDDLSAPSAIRTAISRVSCATTYRAHSQDQPRQAN